MGVIEHPPIIRLPGVPDHVTYTWLVMIVLIGLALAARGQLALVPRGVQNFLEVVLEQFIAMIDDVIGHEGMHAESNPGNRFNGRVTHSRTPAAASNRT